MGHSCSAVFFDGISDYTVTYNPVRKTGISKENLERLKLAHPEIYREYVTTKTSRRFNIKKAKAEAA